MAYIVSCYFNRLTKISFPMVCSLVYFCSCGYAPSQSSDRAQSSSKTEGTEVTEIVLERSACFGECPAYKVAFRLDGSAIYTGEAYTPYIGNYVPDGDSYSRNHFERLRHWLEAQRFFDMREDYDENLVDSSKITITATRNGKKKTVVGDSSRSPIELWGIAMAIDGVASNITWKKVLLNPQHANKLR